MFLETTLLSFLSWAGMIQEKEDLKSFFLKTLTATISLQVTDFGLCVIETLEKSMHEAIPEVLRKLV